MQSTIKTSQLKYLQSLLNIDGSFNFSKKSKPSFLSTSFGVMIDFLKNDHLSFNKENILQYYKTGIDSNLNELIDPALKSKDIKGLHKLDYIQNQITYFSLIAMDVLDYQAPEIANGASDFENMESIEKWFNHLDLSHFWYESNKIMFLLYFLFYVEKYADSNKAEEAKKKIEEIIFLLTKTQDINTGFWGTNLNGNDLYDGCFGAAHIYIFYDYLNLEIPYVEKVIDHTLKLHHSNGLMKSKHGGACEDYDAIDIYLRCLNQTDYRTNEIFDILYKMRQIIKASQNNDGGFSYKIEDSISKNFFYNNILQRSYTYSGWKLMETPSFKSDLWATWFRSLSINVIDYLLDKKEDFNSYNLPAWGFVKK